MEVKKLGSDDIASFIELLLVFEDVFEMKGFVMPRAEYLQQMLAKDDFFVFAAFADNKVVGGLTTYTMQQYYSELPLVYIFDLAVKREYQRKGVGRKLMSSLLTYCKETGVEEVFVQADMVDDHAIEFYRSTGGITEEVVHFNYPLK